jgi:hypothetical protein
MCYTLTNCGHFVTIINKSYTITGQDRSFGLQEVEAPKISKQSTQGVVKFVSSTHRPHLPPGDTLGTLFSQRLSLPQEKISVGRIKSVKNRNDTTGNRTSDFSAVAQRTAPPCTLLQSSIFYFKGEFTVVPHLGSSIKTFP